MADEFNNPEKPNVPSTDTGKFSKGLGLGLPAPIPPAPAELVASVIGPPAVAQTNTTQSEPNKE